MSRTQGCFISENGLNFEEVEMVATGDLGYYDKGQLYYVGRMDNQVKILGKRINLEEIEVKVKNFPGILNVAAVVNPETVTDNLMTSFTLFLVPTQDWNMSLFSQLYRKMLPEKIYHPLQVLLIDLLPHNSNGKVDKKLLKKQLDLYENFVIEKNKEESVMFFLWKLWNTVIMGSRKVLVLELKLLIAFLASSGQFLPVAEMPDANYCYFLSVGGSSLDAIFVQKILQKQFKLDPSRSEYVI
jgi:hypothetical protein